MSVHDDVEILQRIALFSSVKTDHLNALAFAIEHADFATGDIIVQQGGDPEAAYVIVEGEAEVVLGDNEEGDAHSTVEQNSFIGEAAIINNQPYRTTVRAKSDVKVLRITRELLFRSLSEFPDMAQAIMRVLARRLDDTIGDLVATRDYIIQEDSSTTQG